MGYSDDINFILPIEKYDEIRKSLEQDAPGPMQIGRIAKRSSCCADKASQQLVAKPARRRNASFRVPDRSLIGLAPRGVLNSALVQ
jgi:hypothetical protein